MALPENGKKISAWNAGTVDQNSYFLQAKGGATEKVSADEIADYVGSSATFSALNTTSKTPVGAINEVNGKFGVVLTGTLTAGATSITLSDASITATSTIEVYTDIFGAWLENMVVSTGSVVLTFEAQSANMAVKVRVS